MKINYRAAASSVYGCAVWNFMLAMLMFMLCRFVFWIFNTALFPELDISQLPSILRGGLRFDVSALAYGNALWLLMMLLPCRFRYLPRYQSACKGVFVALNSILLAANLMDAVYFPYTLRRTTAGIVKEFGGEAHLGSIIGQSLLDYWYIALIWLVMIAALCLLYRKARRTAFGKGLWHNAGYYGGSAAALALTIFLCIVAMRGGIRHSTRPITLNDAGQYVRQPLEKAIVQNTPHSIFRTIGKKRRTLINYFSSQQELERYYSPVIVLQGDGRYAGRNVVVIVWESFAKEYVGALNASLEGGQYKGYTPFIDSLLPYTLTFSRSYANGRKSIDGLPSIVASIPSVETPFVLSPYSGNEVGSIGSHLREKGYSTAFFHGAPNGSMGFWAFLSMTGFERCYGKDEYCKASREDGGLWGIWDEEFLQYMASELGRMPQPFCAVAFTLSSHAPFILPKRYDGRWAEGPHPITRCITYSDYSLRRFFQAAARQPWFRNTIFVITADHSNHPLHPQYQTSVGQMAVPIIYFAGDSSMRGMRTNVTQQTDIMPTILGMLGYDKPFIAFGNDALHPQDTAIAINYIGGVYQVFWEQYVLLHDGNRPLAFYNLDSDILMKINLLDQAPPTQILALEHRLRAFIQQYNNRLVEGRMAVKN